MTRAILQAVKRASIACLFLVLSSGAAQARDSLPDLLKRVSPAVVTILVYDSTGQRTGTGSGFFVSRNHVVSNHHVLAGAHRAEVKTASGITHAVLGVAADNKTSDLILLEVEVSEQIRPLEVIPDYPEVGERVIVVGSPLGFEQTVSDGIVSSLRVAPEFDTVIQITAPFSPGSSGSPVVNMEGKVIGVASRQMMQGQNLNFAVPGKWVLALAPERPRPLPEWAGTAEGEAAAAADSTLDRMGKEAEALLDAGKYEEALSYLTELAARYPDHPDVMVNIGSCQAHLGNWEEAIFVNERAIELKPDVANAHFNLGTANAMLGRWKEALEAYRKALELNPDDVDALAALAQAQENLGLSLEAMETCRTAIRINPNVPEPYRHMAAAHLNLGQFREAEVQARKALQINPEYVDAHHTLGLACSHLGRHQEAIDAYREALRRSPRFAEAHSNLGLSYAHLERWPEALDEYKRAVRLKPDKVEFHYNLGIAYFRLGDKASALDEHTIIQNLDRKDLADQLIRIIYE